jgi:hypothetical protein
LRLQHKLRRRTRATERNLKAREQRIDKQANIDTSIMDNAVDDSPRDSDQLLTDEKRLRHKGNRWAQQRSDRFICTRDTGPGIRIRKLFEYRSYNGRKRKRQGFNDAKTEFYK